MLVPDVVEMEGTVSAQVLLRHAVCSSVRQWFKLGSHCSLYFAKISQIMFIVSQVESWCWPFANKLFSIVYFILLPLFFINFCHFTSENCDNSSFLKYAVKRPFFIGILVLSLQLVPLKRVLIKAISRNDVNLSNYGFKILCKYVLCSEDSVACAALNIFTITLLYRCGVTVLPILLVIHKNLFYKLNARISWC